MNKLLETELDEIFDFESEQIVKKFEITDTDSLNWAFRKITALKSKRNEIDKLWSAEIERINAWAEKEAKPLDDSLSFFEGLITQYHMKMLAADPKGNKTLSTPYGKSKSRVTKAQPDKADEKMILKHVVENQMDDYIKPSLKWADLKKSLEIVHINGIETVIDENGQQVPGVIVKPDSVSYSVEV
jgi:hypothetical protein